MEDNTGKKLTAETVQAAEEVTFSMFQLESGFTPDLDKKRIMAVIGDINSGKTNLAIYLLRAYKGTRKIYTLGYPKQIDDFVSLNSHKEIDDLTDAIIFIDELSRYYPTKGHTNTSFLSIARTISHSNNTLIFTTQLTQDLTNQMEAFVDTFLITKMADLRTIKEGSKAKFAILDCADFRRTSHSLRLKQGEYLYSSIDSMAGENGIKTFPFQRIGKDWNRGVKGVCVAPCVASSLAPCLAQELTDGVQKEQQIESNEQKEQK